MKKYFFLLVFFTQIVFASIDQNQPPQNLLLIPEDDNPNAITVVQKDEQTGFWKYFEVTKAIELISPVPFSGLGGQLGLSTKNELLEGGAEVTVFTFPEGDDSAGISLGAYVQLAPLALLKGEWWKRIYFRGFYYRAFAAGKPIYNATSKGFAIGYRHPLDTEIDIEKWGYKYFFVELGAERAVLHDYGEDVAILPRGLTLGLKW